MQFHLIYEGPLPAHTQRKHRVEEKHNIRRIFHKQLAKLWVEHPFLKTRSDLKFPDAHDASRIVSWVGAHASAYNRSGYNFLPLVGSLFDIACSLDILFLRRNDPGDLVKKGGDIDNRIKVLFDALRIPEKCNELPENAKPGLGEDPFYCLLENDQLITGVRITTDRLLTPANSQDSQNDVVLVIRVRTMGTGASTFTALAT